MLFHYIYPDHYQYSLNDIIEMRRRILRDNSGVPAKGADLIITTEKDLVRLDREMRSILIAECDLAVLEMEVKIDKKKNF